MTAVWKNSLVRARRAVAGISPVVLGTAFIRTWVHGATPLLPNEPLVGVITAENMFDITCAITALAFAFLAGRLGNVYLNRRFMRASAILVAFSSAVLWLLSESNIAPLGILAALAAGVGFMSSSLTWCAFYMSFNPARMILYYCVAHILSEFLIFAFDGYSPPQLYCVLIALPFLSDWTLKRSVEVVGSEEGLSASASSRPFPWKPALFLATYALAYSIAHSASGVLSGYPAMFLYVIPSVLFIACVVLEPGKLPVRWLYLGICVFMLVALLLPVALSELPGGISAAFISLSYDASKTLGVLILGSISYRLGISALWLLGITRAFSYMGLFLGNACYRSLELANGALSVSLCVILALAVVISSFLLLSEQGLNANWQMVAQGGLGVRGEDTGLGGNATSPAGPLVAIAQARDLYGLTAREEEILCLLAQKKTVPTIAADMFLAQGTVKAHVQHIYQKMDIHSRKELEAFLGVK